MTAYSNFVKDFPTRCRDILKDYKAQAQQTGHEVTLTLTIASAAFVIPFERLNPSAADHLAADRHRECVKKMGKLLGRHFASWAPGASWRQGPLIAGSAVRGKDVEQWLDATTLQPIDPARNVGSVLVLLRNSLAHGNLYSYPSGSSASDSKPITELIFLAKRRHPESDELLDEYNMIVVNPADFLAFLELWIAFLDELDLPEQPTQHAYIQLPTYTPAIAAP